MKSAKTSLAPVPMGSGSRTCSDSRSNTAGMYVCNTTQDNEWAVIEKQEQKIDPDAVLETAPNSSETRLRPERKQQIMSNRNWYRQIVGVRCDERGKAKHTSVTANHRVGV